MKLGTKLGLAMASLVLFLVIIGGFSLVQMANMNEDTYLIAREGMPAAIAAEEMNTAMSDFRLQQMQHLLSSTPEEMNKYAKRMDAKREAFEKASRAYAAVPMDEADKILYNELLALWEEYFKLSERTRLMSEQQQNEAARAELNGQGMETFEAMTAKMQDLTAYNKQISEEAGAQSEATYATARALVLGLIVVATALAALVAVYIIRNTLAQLGKDPGELAVLAKQVAGGRLELDADPHARGVYAEILTMVDTLKRHIENARQESERAQEESRKAQEAMVQADAAGKDAQAKRDGMLAAADRLEEVAGIVSSASAELSAQIEQSERGAAEQAARVTETATAMEEMNSTVLEVAKNAGNASDVSAATRHKAEQGANVVGEAVTSIREVRDASLTLKEDMAALSEQAQSINQIMAVISDIADQTNLLALNAAIEAARAGEAGRGFAVVADEVRNLAEKTMASTTDVGNAIKAIQDSAAKSMAQVDDAVSRIEQATDLATRSGDALKEIVNMVDNTADQVRSIATASEQQSATSEEITRSVGQVNTIATETARAMEEAARAVSELAGQAQVLSGLIDEMKRA